MLALAGIPLGFRFRFLEPNPEPSVRDLGEVVQGSYDDPTALESFGAGLDVATYEFENVPADALRRLEPRVPVFPPPGILALTQDRLSEKEGFDRLGIPTTSYRPVDVRSDLERGLDELGVPAILKTRRFGYDGKGQILIRDRAEADSAWSRIGGPPLLLEGFVRFRRELSLIAARGRDGTTVMYPLVENRHEEGILVLSRAPAQNVSPAFQGEAEALALRLLEDQSYVGVLALELFDTEDGLLANEVAPRVHNSGHWTQNGAKICQFENHLRAISGLPLGSAAAEGFSGMVNLLGKLPDRAGVLALSGTHLHLYGKSPRPGRKLGHINVRGSSPGELESRLGSLLEVLGEK